MKSVLKFLKERASWVRKQTLGIHKTATETRIASCLSDIELFVVLYYGKILNFNPNNTKLENRDRFIISKAHGAVSLYPILSDLGFFHEKELKNICKKGGILGSIPDCSIPGFEVITGSLGQGLGIACGMSLALKRKKNNSAVVVLIGDGELYEGSTWEAIMFAAHHKLDNLLLIVDNNKICMLDFCKNVIDLEPLDEKFRSFNWHAQRADGHDIKESYQILRSLKNERDNKPKVLIADTIKGKGIPRLEKDPLCHIRSLNKDEIDSIVGKIK